MSNLANTLQLLVLLIPWSVTTDGVNIRDVQTALPGDNPVFSCSNNGPPSMDFQMQFKPVGSNNPIIIYSESSNGLKPAYAPRYMVSQKSESYELTVMNASSNQMGTYICDWGDRTLEFELVLIEPSGPTCDSTVLRNDNCGIEVRFDCRIGFHGNVLPTVEFWMMTDGGTFGPITASPEKEYNTSRTTLLQNISYGSRETHYVCQLRNINIQGLQFRSICNFESNDQSCEPAESEEGKLSKVIAIGVIVAMLLITAVSIAALLKTIIRLRKQLRSLLANDNRNGEEFAPLLISNNNPKSTRGKIELEAIAAIKQEHVQHFHTTKSTQVRGVVWMKDRIFMCGLGSNTIYVFAGNSPFNLEQNISIPLSMSICDLSACAADDDNSFLFFRNSYDPKFDGGPHKSYVWRCDIPDESFHLFKFEGQILKMSSTLSGEILILKRVNSHHFISVLDPVRAREQQNEITKLPTEIIIAKPEQFTKLANGNLILTGHRSSEWKIEEEKTIQIFEINVSNGDIVHACCSFSCPNGNTFSLPGIYTLTLGQHDSIFITDNRNNEIVVIDLNSGMFRIILGLDNWDAINEKTNEKPFQNIHYIPEKHMALEIRSNLATILL